jgi:transcriptional regulator with XRE-family HTH domain
MPGAIPNVHQRELGAHLRQLRHGRGLTVDDVARELLCSATKISRIETGARAASLRDVRDLCRIYGVADPTDLMDLAKRAREPGWWTRFEDLGLGPYIGLEQEATAIKLFSMYFVPGLLQTADYARAIITGIAPKMESKILDQRIEARMRRQQVLEREDPPRFEVLLDEAVLHRQVGGPDVMAAQLDRILQRVREQKASVRVIPFTAGAHGSVDSNFVFFDFADASIPNMIFIEGLSDNIYRQRPAELERYLEALKYLRNAALSPRDSANLIAQIRSRHAD